MKLKLYLTIISEIIYLFIALISIIIGIQVSSISVHELTELHYISSFGFFICALLSVQILELKRKIRKKLMTQNYKDYVSLDLYLNPEIEEKII